MEQTNMHKSTPVTQSNYCDKSLRRFGYTLAMAMLLTFGGWAGFAPLNSAVVAPATVTVEGFRKKVQHLEGGIVSEIHAKEGQFVAQNQLLLTLDKTQLEAQIQILDTEILSAMALQSRLVAERNNDSEPDFSKLNANGSVGTEIYASQLAVFHASRDSRLGEQQILQNKIEQLQASKLGLKALITSKQARIQSYQLELEDFGKLADRGYSSKQQVRHIERLKAEIEGEVAEHRSQIASLEIQSGETELQILQLSRQFLLDTTSQLDEVQSLILDKTERRKALLEKLTRSDIVAPVAGRVLGTSVHTIGGVIMPAETILELVPEEDALIVDARVSPAEVSRLTPGQRVDLRFSTLKQAKTMVLYGEVLSVSADKLTDQQQDYPYYLARISVLPSSQERLLNAGVSLLPGMPAEVHIKTGEQTLMAYMMQPVRDMFARSLTEQ